MTPKPLGGLLTPVVAYRLRDNNSLTIFLRSLIGLGGELFQVAVIASLPLNRSLNPRQESHESYFPGK